jgi:hypothetical protein
MTVSTRNVEPFIQRWAASGAAERANYQLFLTELCSLLDVPPPEPTRPDDADNAYVFERNVHFVEDDGSTSIGRIDLYKRGAFVHEQGLVSVLRQIHDDLDAAVFAAYGWPLTLSDDEILERLVALNAERAAEEARGLVRWLRPEFQNPAGGGAKQQGLSLVEEEGEEGVRASRRGKGSGDLESGSRQAGSLSHGREAGGVKHAWPKGRAAQAKAVLAVLRDCPGPVTAEELAQRFTHAHRESLDELLQALVTLGQGRRTRGGKYTY